MSSDQANDCDHRLLIVLFTTTLSHDYKPNLVWNKINFNLVDITTFYFSRSKPFADLYTQSHLKSPEAINSTTRFKDKIAQPSKRYKYSVKRMKRLRQSIMIKK